ncbi:MAG: type II toxin-antitoxin system RelE/ParE family toxin [Gammaproteobacteria bacterium]
MKYELAWTEPALCDLERIDRYLRRRNPAAAKKLGEGLLLRAQILKIHPEIGRVYDPDLPHRVLLHRRYKIFYRVLHDQRIVEIAHIRHTARDNPTLDDLLTD